MVDLSKTYRDFHNYITAPGFPDRLSALIARGVNGYSGSWIPDEGPLGGYYTCQKLFLTSWKNSPVFRKTVVWVPIAGGITFATSLCGTGNATKATHIALATSVEVAFLYPTYEWGWSKLFKDKYDPCSKWGPVCTGVKTVVYRGLSGTATSLIALWFTGERKTAMAIGAVDITFKLAAYYAHEIRSHRHGGFTPTTSCENGEASQPSRSHTTAIEAAAPSP